MEYDCPTCYAVVTDNDTRCPACYTPFETEIEEPPQKRRLSIDLVGEAEKEQDDRLSVIAVLGNLFDSLLNTRMFRDHGLHDLDLTEVDGSVYNIICRECNNKILFAGIVAEGITIKGLSPRVRSESLPDWLQ